jgi:hypothetical protein
MLDLLYKLVEKVMVTVIAHYLIKWLDDFNSKNDKG